MNITRLQLKEIIREELIAINEKTIKTKGGIKIEFVLLLLINLLI